MRLIKFLLTLPIIILVLGTAGCARNLASIQKLDQLPPNEAIVFGRLRVLIEGKDATPYSNLMFKHGRQVIGGTVKQLVVDDDGVIFASLPAGENYFWRIISNRGPFTTQYEHIFGPADATLQLPQAGGVYYIGDITIDWTYDKNPSLLFDSIQAIATGYAIGGSSGGAYIGAFLMPYDGGNALITASDNLAENQKLFHERTQSDKILVPAFLQIKSAKTETSSQKH